MQDTRPALRDTTRHEFREAWPVILACAMGVGLGITGLPLYGMGQFVRPLGDAFGWSRGAVSAGALYLSLGTVLTAPIVGRITDRVGVRRVAMLSIIATAFGFGLLSLNQGSLIAYDATWLAISFLGCGTTPVIWTRAINIWFNRRRGLALGMAQCGTGLSALAAPLVLGRAVNAFGWRAGYLAQSAALLLVALPLVWLFLKDRSQGAILAEAQANAGTVEPPATTLRQAMRGSAFWRLFIGIFVLAVVIAGSIVQMVPLLTDRGVSPAQAAGTLSVLGAAIITGRLVIGFLLDRLPPSILAIVTLMMPAVSCLVLLLDGPPLAATLLLGFATGADVDLLPYLTSRRFGLRSYAELFGWLISSASLGGGLGPILAGSVHDATGSYSTALYVGIALSGLGACLIASVALETTGEGDRFFFEKKKQKTFG